ncbi:helix-hairpin-helix domain-containing protein [Methanosalsum natronophilum]|uniref:helix-hairpin-helix domain-containing protein n=1 Tax=Methanosalsum natronophilum TaxID=768733 RepID=UPI0021681618|nr:helix-hairpin-helix domain-containing protein [Methanosalsum natronophilum]MCS3924433.1 competence ComEA-like helix-hairpin-helix protein [Methanosalsum natronophilum]
MGIVLMSTRVPNLISRRDASVPVIAALVLVFFTVVGASIIVLVVFDISPQSPASNVIIKTTVDSTASGDIIRVQHLGGDSINLDGNDVKVIVNGVESFDYPSNTLFSVGDSIYLSSVTTKIKININKATKEEMAKYLDAIGDTLAQRIVDNRTDHGPFKSLDDITRVSGIGPVALEDLEDQGYATVDGPAKYIRININTANKEELEYIDQIGDDRSNQIIDLRKDKTFTSFNDLRVRVSGIGSENVNIIMDQGYVVFDGTSIFNTVPENQIYVQRPEEINLKLVDANSNLIIARSTIRYR